MTRSFGWISIIGLYFMHNVVAFHNGAPCSTQYTMTPSTIFHGVPQNPVPKPPPYQFAITDLNGNPVTKYKDEVYKIHLIGLNTSFRGFLLQARPATAEGYPIGHLRAGMFVYDSSWQLQGVKIQPCPGVFNDSLTHATNDDKSMLEVHWKPLKNYGPILFMLTIVQNRTLFWTQWTPSSGLIFPEDGANFGSAGEVTGDVSTIIKGEEGTTALIEVTPEAKQGTKSVDSTADSEEPTTFASTKRHRSGKGHGRSKKPKTTTIAPIDGEDSEITNEANQGKPSAGRKEPATGSLPPAHQSSERLPPAPAAVGAGGDDSRSVEGEDLKAVALRPSLKGKAGAFAPIPSGEVEVGTQKPESAGGPSNGELETSSVFSPSPSPNAKGTKGEKLPPATPAIVEESAESNRTVDRPPERLVQPPPLAQAGGQTSRPEELSIIDYCAEKPCVNNGTCNSFPDEERYECKCPKQWAGPQCAAPNLCQKHKCKNNAQCVNGEDKYACKCARGWAGEFCDKSCPAQLCENGGTCVITNDQYACLCLPGYTGPKCHDEIKHCDSQPCQNGATCVHKFNAFECKCKDGYMGETCHRPCQDIYRSCEFWGEQEKCESQRPTTKWFDINCARTCAQCKFENRTVNVPVSLPPVLEPFEFILGRWTINSTSNNRFPMDFMQNNTGGYYEELIFSVAEVPQFGPPSLNMTAIAINNLNPRDVMVSAGFLTVKPATVPLKTFFMSTGNDGITVVEDGFTNSSVIQLNSTYFAILPSVDNKAPATAKRTFSIANQYLKEDVIRTTNSGQKDYFTKYYWRQDKFPIY